MATRMVEALPSTPRAATARPAGTPEALAKVVYSLLFSGQDIVHEGAGRGMCEGPGRL